MNERKTFKAYLYPEDIAIINSILADTYIELQNKVNSINKDRGYYTAINFQERMDTIDRFLNSCTCDS